MASNGERPTLLGAFTPSTGLYSSRLVTNELASDSNEHLNNQLRNHLKSNNNSNKQQLQTQQSAIGDLIVAKKSDLLLHFLLGGALLAAISSTLMLSFVIKSLQLDESASINTKIRWDEQTESSTFESSVRLSSPKSISLAAIQSIGLSPLNLELAADYEGAFLVAGGTSQKLEGLEHTKKANVLNRVSFKSNYMAAVNLNQLSDRGMSDGVGETTKLELGTKILRLRMIQDENYNNNFKNVRVINETSQLARDSKKTLLELNAELESIWLPHEKSVEHLNSLMWQASSSITVDELLKSNELTGAIGQDFDLQSTRGTDLNCKSGLGFKMVSKSGEAKISASEEVVVSASELRLAGSGQLLLPAGLSYFNSEPAEAQPETTKDAHGRLGHRHHDKAATSRTRRRNRVSEEAEMRAFNLVLSEDGTLLAVA